MTTMRKRLAVAIARELIRQDDGDQPADPFDGRGDLKWPYIDQGEVDFGQIVDAVFAALGVPDKLDAIIDHVRSGK